MQKPTNHQDYVIIANLYESEKINVKLTYKKENSLSNLYILNEFPYNKDDLKIFKILFNLFNCKDKPRDFESFFVTDDNFYAVFKYCQSPNIPLKFKKDLITAKFEERCFLLENILIRIEKYYRQPIEFVGCISKPENITVDNENNVHFTYNFKNMQNYSNKDKKIVFDHIHEIIYTILRPEADQGFNKQLHIVLDKCKNGVYSSVPELVVELKKAEVVSKASTWLSYIKYQFGLHKPKIMKLTKQALTLVLVAGLFKIAHDKLEKSAKTTVNTAVSIAGINYTGNKDDESDKTLNSENTIETSPKESTQNGITLSEGLDMEYEDYIVQDDDTVASIAENYYKDQKYITAIATFNGISVNEKLTPGSILKLPNRTAIALYTSK